MKWVGDIIFIWYIIYIDYVMYLKIEEYLDEGYYNSYMLITEKVSLDSLIVDDMKRGSFTFLMHDPFTEPSAKTVQKIIDYFAQIEEYEICYELKELLDKKIGRAHV